MLLRDVLDRERVLELARVAERVLDRVRELAEREGVSAVERWLPERCRYVPTASSIGLAALDRETRRDLATDMLLAGGLLDELVEVHGSPVVHDIDQAWLRRQYAPRDAPRGHFPHGWHQDGALGCDFTAQTACAERTGLLELVTCWIPLVAAGGQAPGLELVAAPLERVLAPSELVEENVRAAFPHAPRWKPDLHAGDVLLVASGTLHRTHVTPDMTRTRNSIELRVFPAHARPARLASDRFSPPLGTPRP